MANPRKPKKDINKSSSSTSWAVVRTILTFKQHQPHNIITRQEEQPLHPNKQHHLPPPPPPPSKQHPSFVPEELPPTAKHKKMRCSGSLCSNTKVVVAHNTTTYSPETHKRGVPRKSPRSEPIVGNGSALTSTMSSSSLLSSSSASSNGRSSRRMTPFGRLSGCYECRMVVDPASGLSRDPSSGSSIRSSVCCCPDCGEVFMKTETLELHQAIKHAVTELGAEDTSKSVVEIIFQSSWLKKQSPTCKIDRILKVHNKPGTVAGFEQHRDSIKTRAAANKKNPRCLADGNELLRFYCASLACLLGLNGSTNLCSIEPQHRSPCGVCNIIRNGFKASDKGVMTTATSGRAHDNAGFGTKDKRAMLVCRVIAGRVKRSGVTETNGEGIGIGTEDRDYDSMAKAGECSNMMDELIVFNPKAILPCFVVIYKVI